MEGSSHEEQWPRNVHLLGRLSCTTFNILAPIYKRLNGKENCENEFPELWLSRNDSILNKLLELKSSIICLQEFWVGNEELVRMYEKRLGEAGYTTFKLARPNNRGDGFLTLAGYGSNQSYQFLGLLTAVHQNFLRVLNYKECLFNGIGDRVAQLLYVELLVPSEDKFSEITRKALIVNTHLIFPHDSRYCFVRLQQVYKILQFIESYCYENKLPEVPIILCGDWNGSMKGNVCKFLLSQGFISTYDVAHHYVENTADQCNWVSHRNHRGNICAVDFVWLLNPNVHRKPLKRSFMEALLGNVYNMQSKMSGDESCITFSQFTKALTEIGLIGPRYNVFSLEEIEDLWKHIDCNEAGAINISHFSGSWNEQTGTQSNAMVNAVANWSTICFNVDKATLFPAEVERGMWPENYSLSDHAQLTVEFAVLQSNGY